MDFKSTFYPAEAPLNCMNRYLKTKGIIKNDREAYKADGIFSYNDIEFSINEISGPFKNNDKRKYQFDYHKALYGCLSMIWCIVQKFYFAEFETLEKLQVFFIHAKSM